MACISQNCAYFYSNIEIIEKGAYLNFTMGANLHRFANETLKMYANL